MSNEQYDIDNDDNLVNFDPYDDMGSNTRRRPLFRPVPPGRSAMVSASKSSHDTPSASRELDERVEGTSSAADKGKQVSIAMPIRSPTIIHDLFDVSPPDTDVFGTPTSSFITSPFSSFASSSFAFSSPGSSTGSPAPFQIAQSLSQVLGLEALEEGPSAPPDPSWKGKSREVVPTLPPLTLGSGELGDDAWMSFDSARFSSPSSSLSSPGSYSAGSETPNIFARIGAPSPSLSTSPATSEGSSKGSTAAVRLPLRSKSLSNLSMDSTTSSTTVNTKSKSRTSSFLSRKFLFNKKTDESSTRPASPTTIPSAMTVIEIPTIPASGNAPRQWYTAPSVTIDASALISRPPPPIPVLALETALPYPALRSTLRHKGRSHSAPLPFSALDYVQVVSTDIFEPLQLLIKNYFDDIIPRELRLRILGSLVQVHVDSHQRMVESERWSANRAAASRHQWVGRDKGLKELIRLSRVSKSWRSMVFDGQLWVNVDLHSFPGLPREILQHITKSAGPFIQSLNLAGLTSLDSVKLLDVASDLCLMAPQESLSYTQLTAINLQGCTNLTTRSLHHLLIRSRSLETLNLKGLGAVTNTTFEILATYCPALRSLNMNRCMNMDSEGIYYMASAAIARREHLQLKELRLCGLKHSSDSMMAALGKAAPHLEVLDLSYARRLHNSALEAFVACDDEDGPELDTVVVSARDLGREAGDISYFRRRVTRLRHLNLSFCLLLTDTACVNLAYSLPRLEYLEMAGIGADLQEAGLIRLFERTPFIKRVDLEDAIEVGDNLLAALTPALESPPLWPISTTPQSTSKPPSPPQAGHALQYLNVSSSVNVTDQGLLSLVRRCPQLTTLEADGTKMTNAVLRDFVRLCRGRQACNAKIVGVDCRGIGENVVKELSRLSRPRLGWRSYAARRLYYLDERDGNEDDLKVGQDECDEKRVVVKTFYSWQTVDAVKANREKRRKAAGSGGSRRAGNGSSGAEWDSDMGYRRTRWWAPGGRRISGSGRASPLELADVNEGCRAM